MTHSVIVSLAVLKANWDVRKKDYIDNFLPFVAECVRTSPDDVVSLPDVQAGLRSSFHLQLPQNVILTILRRMSRTGWLVNDHGAYRRDTSKLAQLGFDAVRRDAALKYDALVRDLSDFCRKNYQVDWSVQEAEKALEAYINDNQMLVMCIGSGTHIQDAGPMEEGTTRFLVGSYIQSLYKINSPQIVALETIILGNMLANAVFLPDPNQAVRRFRDTAVYLDAPFLLFALGYAGKERKHPCAELLILLRETGATLRCFRHTLDEMRNALDACAFQLEQGTIKDAYGPSMDYFLSAGKTGSDVRLYSARLEDDLAKHQIGVAGNPSYDEHDFVIDEAGLQKELDAAIGYRNPTALERDVKSVAAIMRLRRGQIPSIAEESEALFVTMNTGLVRVSSAFVCQDEAQNGVAPCITDYALTNLLWLKNPTKAPDLPRKRIIADYYAATQPSEELWRRYLAEIAKLEQEGTVTAQDYYLLRHHLQARSVLMDLTLGDETAFTQGTVPEILARVQASIRDNDEREHRKEIEKREREHGDELSRLEDLARAERMTREEAERRAFEVAQREAKRRERIVQQAERGAHVRGKMLKILLTVLLAVASVTTFPWGGPPLSSSWLRYCLFALWLVLTGIGFVNLVWGTPVLVFLDRIQAALGRRIEKRLLRDAGFEDE